MVVDYQPGSQGSLLLVPRRGERGRVGENPENEVGGLSGLCLAQSRDIIIRHFQYGGVCLRFSSRWA